VVFSLPEKPYKVRADYLGYQFWSDEISVATDASVSLSVPHGDVMVTVRGRV
jgi:hypothetical protein